METVYVDVSMYEVPYMYEVMSGDLASRLGFDSMNFKADLGVLEVRAPRHIIMNGAIRALENMIVPTLYF